MPHPFVVLIRRVVREAYERVGREGSRAPEGLGFPTGAALAEALGYPPAELREAPAEILEAFVGSAALAPRVRGPADGWVLDVGCGAGLDAWLLARRGFRVAALDASEAMLARLARSGRGRGGRAPHPVRCALPEVPLRGGIAGWALLNGVANLVPERTELLVELRRVLRPGGRLLVADLFASSAELPPELRGSPEAWAWCVGGAASRADWTEELRSAGFGDVEISLVEEVPPLARGVLSAVRP